MDANSQADLRSLNELNFARMDAKMADRFAEVDARLERRLGEIRAEMKDQKAELIKWMFLFFTGSALANILLR